VLSSQGADTKKVRTINRAVILNSIREQGPVSKATLARMTGISLPTVNRVIDELCQEDLILPSENQLERGGGRPGELFQFNGRSHFVIGVDLGTPNLRGMIANLAGEVQKEITIPLEVGDWPENYRRLLTLIEQLRKGVDDSHSLISGIGLGVAGIVDHTNGVVLRSPLLGWENFPLARRLKNDVDLPIYLDSDINLITIGEHGFGVGLGTKNLMCINLGTRMYCGMIINGELFRGSNFNGGRIGQFIPTLEALNVDASAPSSLESMVAANGIMEKARAVLEPLDSTWKQNINDAKGVYRAAREGKAWAIEIIESMVAPLAITVANLSFLLEPEVIVFSGRMAEEAQMIIPKITRFLNGKIPQIPHIEASTLGTRATVLGAVMLVYKGILQNR
jgi:predicted NBD/HSP70 family sugar kinase